MDDDETEIIGGIHDVNISETMIQDFKANLSKSRLSSTPTNPLATDDKNENDEASEPNPNGVIVEPPNASYTLHHPFDISIGNHNPEATIQVNSKGYCRRQNELPHVLLQHTNLEDCNNNLLGIPDLEPRCNSNSEDKDSDSINIDPYKNKDEPQQISQVDHPHWARHSINTLATDAPNNTAVHRLLTPRQLLGGSPATSNSTPVRLSATNNGPSTFLDNQYTRDRLQLPKLADIT